MRLKKWITALPAFKPDRKTEIFILGMVLILLFWLQSALLTDGHGWGDDFALYLRQAQNIADGRDYADTGYIYNTREPLYSPKVYPPAYPLILSVVYKIAGLDFLRLKTVSVCFYVLYLGLLYLFFRKRFAFPVSLLVVILFGINPAFLIELDQILSDFVFLFFTMLAILLLERFLESPSAHWAVAAAVTIWFAYGSRSIGIVLIPGVFFAFIFRYRRVSKELILLVGLSGFFVILQKIILHEGAYFNFRLLLSDLPGTIWFNIGYYAKILTNALVMADALSVVLILSGFAIGGFISEWKEMDLADCFFVLYLGLLLVFPSIQGTRYIYPLIPFFLMYILYFLRRANGNASNFFPFFLFLICIGFFPEYIRMRTTPAEFPEATGDEAMALYASAGELPEGGFYFRKPRALAFFADVHAGLISNQDLNQLETTLSEADRLGIRYFVEDKHHFSRFQTIQELNPEMFAVVYQNPGFVVYEKQK